MVLETIALQGDDVTLFVVLAVFSFLPPAIFVVWIRNTERFGREPWGLIASTFVWGALFAVFIGAVLSVVLLFLFRAVPPIEEFLAGRFLDPTTILLAIVIAPLAEEFAKGYGVWRRRRVMREPEDGLIYGATSGLGFSATENLLYGVAALVTLGIEASIVTIAIRSISSSLLHASATSLTGYGIARRAVWGAGYSFLPWYLAAVVMHAAFNGLASLGTLLAEQYGEVGALLVLVSAVLFALITIAFVRGRIMDHEAQRGWTP